MLYAFMQLSQIGSHAIFTSREGEMEDSIKGGFQWQINKVMGLIVSPKYFVSVQTKLQWLNTGKGGLKLKK